MAPTKKQLKNREYCQKYRQKNLEELRKRDKERKKLERDHSKFFQRDKYEEYKKKDRERKAAEKVENIINDSTRTPIPQSSSFKHKCTKIRSLKKAENALPQSSNKKKEIIASLASKYQLRIALIQKKRPGPKRKALTGEQIQWLVAALDRPDISHMNPGKNDNVYIGKVDGVKHYEQKRYFLWPLRDILDILNGSVVNQSETYTERFAEKLTFSMFYKFIKMHKEYVFHKNIPHYTCLCEVCENTVLLAKGLGHACKSQHVPSDPHSIVKFYSCNDSGACMMNLCDECSTHGLTEEDFTKKSSESDSDDTSKEDCDSCIQFYQWKKNDAGYITKMHVVINIEQVLELWQEKITALKKHIFPKRQQYAECKRMKAELRETELMIYVDFSENYKSQQQNEIQSAYFGHSTFSLFTSCVYYRNTDDGEVKKIPITVTTEASDKSRITAISCVDMAINHSLAKITNNIVKVFIISDGCAAQFRSRYVFMLLTMLKPELSLEWHYNEAHHGKGPMDGVGGTVKNMVYRRVLAGDVVIDNPKKFADFANEVCHVDSLFLPGESLMQGPEQINYAEPIPHTLQTHRVVRCFNERNVPYNKFYYLSSDEEPHFTQWYGKECDHAENDVDENTCCYCKGRYGRNEEWIECPICKKWFHEHCFYL